MTMPKKTTPTKSEGELWLSSDELSDIVRRHVAHALGVPCPVAGSVIWAWSPGKGPVAHVTIESVPNVVPIGQGRRR